MAPGSCGYQWRVRLLFLGDIVGAPGRLVVRKCLPGLRDRLQVDAVIANGENAAGGSGITRATAKEILDAGVDVITCGDHLWKQKEVLDLIRHESRFLRPINYPEGTPGRGSGVFQAAGGIPFGVINAQGRIFMAPLENPFHLVSKAVEALRQECQVGLLDFHAEATSEKIAMGRMLDGRWSAVVGTHTHVQTADEQVFPNGLGFLCDAGFCGPHDGVIGREWEPVVEGFKTQMPQKFPVGKGNLRLQGAVFDVDESTGLCRIVTRLNEALDEEASCPGK